MLAIQSQLPAKHLQFVSVFTPLLQAFLHLALDLRELFQNLGLDGEGIAGFRPRRPQKRTAPENTTGPLRVMM